MYILIFQLDCVLHFCLDLNDCQPIYASKKRVLEQTLKGNKNINTKTRILKTIVKHTWKVLG